MNNAAERILHNFIQAYIYILCSEDDFSKKGNLLLSYAQFIYVKFLHDETCFKTKVEAKFDSGT